MPCLLAPGKDFGGMDNNPFAKLNVTAKNTLAICLVESYLYRHCHYVVMTSTLICGLRLLVTAHVGLLSLSNLLLKSM